MLNTQLKFSSSFHPQTDGQTETINKSLGDILCCLVGDHAASWDQILPMVEFTYDSLVSRSTCRSPFECVTGVLPKKPIDLVPLPNTARPSVEVDAFAKYICDIHDEIKRRIATSNESYKTNVDLRRRFAKFEGDMVMVRIKPERYPKGTYKKLHSKSIGQYKVLKKISSNAYVLDLPKDMGISNVFNVEDLTIILCIMVMMMISLLMQQQYVFHQPQD